MKPKGFTLIELMIVLALMGFVFGSTALAFSRIGSERTLQSKGYEIIQALREARTEALTRHFDSAWGVKLDLNTDPNRFIYFKGSSYVGRDIAFDRISELPSLITFSDVLLQGGGTEIIFSSGTGATGQSGDFHLTVDNKIFEISVNPLGLIRYIAQP